MTDGRVAGSFRDPSGILYWKEGVLLRSIGPSYRDEFIAARDSGLHDALIQKGWLIPHQIVEESEDSFVIQPEVVPFVSYPYEWCFSQLQDAALLTLRIQKECVKRGFTLKDASAFNVQFLNGKPVFIDTLSFERRKSGDPWVAYGQFCRHFLAPLALMSRVDARLGSMLRVHLDGIPLDLASRMLPWRTKFDSSLAMHIHVHAKLIETSKQSAADTSVLQIDERKTLAVLDSLKSSLCYERPRKPRSDWMNYYAKTNYSQQAMRSKEQIVMKLLDYIEPRPKTVWDLGANDGTFSLIARELEAFVVSMDSDVNAVEKHYNSFEKCEVRGLPLVQDFSNPSPGIGWWNSERDSLTDRGPADAVMALALIHHLAIGNNVPFDMIAEWFAKIGKWLIIEFVPKEDSQIQRMLASRKDVFSMYSEDTFVEAFAKKFAFVDRIQIDDSARSIYLMCAKT